MASSWVADWSWGLPLLVLTIVAHVSAIVLTAKMLGLTGGSHSRKASRFIVFVALAALACTVYLGLEAAAWAGSLSPARRLGRLAGRDTLFARRDHQLRSRPHLSRRSLAAPRRDRGGQRPHPLRPDDRISLRRHS